MLKYNVKKDNVCYFSIRDATQVEQQQTPQF